MNDIFIVNAELVIDGRRWHGDLRIRDGRIDQTADNIPARSSDTVIDAAGHWQLHGVIDDQIHFRDPGMKYKGYLETESRAAAVGAITSFMVDPNRPQTAQRADVLSRCGWSPYEGVTFRSSIASTFVNGQPVWLQGRMDSVRGIRLEFNR